MFIVFICELSSLNKIRIMNKSVPEMDGRPVAKCD